MIETAQLLPVRAWLVTWDPDSQAADVMPRGEALPFPKRLLDQHGGLASAALRMGRRSLVPEVDAPGDYPERPYLVRSGGAWAFLPLVAWGQPVACLVLRASTPAALEGSPRRSLEAALPIMATHLRAMALKRGLDARVEERTQEVSTLFEISRALGFVVSPDELCALLGSSLHRLLGMDLCAFTFLLSERKEMVVQLWAAADESAARKIARLAKGELARLGAVGTTPVAVRVQRPAPSRGASPLRAADVNAVAHVPLVLHGSVAGLISVASRAAGAYPEARLRLLYTVANQASLTLDRLRTTREAEDHRVHSMLESMAEGVLMLDQGLRVVMCNPAAKAFLPSLTTGRSRRRLSQLGEVPLRPLMEQLLRPDPRPRTFEASGSRDGRLFSVTCSPVAGPAGGAQGMVVVVSDITEARQAERQLAQSEKLSALGGILSGAAHELNNPLASVIANAQLLQRSPVDESTRRKLATIDAEASRCREIVRVLLLMTPQATEKRPVDVNELIRASLQMLDRLLRDADVEVRLDLEHGLRPVIGESHLLRQVFINIINNASQAMKEKGGAGVLTVRSWGRDDQVLVEMADTGPGIAARNLRRIFDPFFSTKGVGKGTGLGLHLAFTTVRDHGGSLQASSRPPHGATFRVELPAAPVGVEAESLAPAAMTRPAFTDPDGAAEAGRVLVVEDEAPLAEVMAEILAAQGHEVDTARDGRTAWKRIKEIPYDVIISDLRMPNMGGREFYRRVAAFSPVLARRIIFSTGDTASPDTMAFFREVGNPILSKPFNLTDLVGAVAAVLARDAPS